VTSDNGAHAEPVHLDEKGHKSNGNWRGPEIRCVGGRPPCAVHRSLAGQGETAQHVRADDLRDRPDGDRRAAHRTSVPDGAGEDSVSFLGLLDGSTTGPTREATILHSVDGAFAVRQGDWMLILCRGSGGWTLREAGATKQSLPPIQLYNLRDDPGETKNVAAAHEDVVQRLNALLLTYQSEGRSVPRRASVP
jgi:arylsulfatase A-like enzyme